MLNHENGAQPLYAQISQILKAKIEHGEYTKGDMFPTEKVIMDTYNVSRVTVRQAFAELSNAGYIKSARGIGTTVIYEKIDEHLKSVISLTDEMKKHNITMQTTYCNVEKVYPEIQVAKALKIPKTDMCYRLERVRCVDEKPLVYTITYLKNIVELPMESKYYLESLYKYLRDTYDIVIGRGTDTLEATLPTEDVQKFLEIEKEMPVFKRVRQTFINENEIFEYSICYYPGNRYKYTVDL